MALNSLFCADVPLSNYSLTLPMRCVNEHTDIDMNQRIGY